jgi:hypothetical protein
MKRLIGYAMAAAMLASGLGFNATALAQAGSTPSENAYADARQCRHAHSIPETRRDASAG